MLFEIKRTCNLLLLSSYIIFPACPDAKKEPLLRQIIYLLLRQPPHTKSINHVPLFLHFLFATSLMIP